MIDLSASQKQQLAMYKDHLARLESGEVSSNFSWNSSQVISSIFVSSAARLLDGDKIVGLCREFGISRKTGYKILTRYNEIGWKGSATARVGPTATPISCPFRSRRGSCA